MSLSGVNLGGWLVLERWITPSLFAGLVAQDEYSFCQEKPDALEVLTHHRNSFITTDDLVWLKDHGVEAIRLPVPHWTFVAFGPHFPCERYVDWLMAEAERLELKVVLDLHTAPGSQNGNDHSGRIGPVRWPKAPEFISATLDVIELLAMHYGQSPQLLGISLLNEPSKAIDRHLLEVYYQEGYKRVRKHCSNQTAVVINDQFDPLEWQDAMTQPEFINVWLDTHLYQAFSNSAAGRQRRIPDILRKTREDWHSIIEAVEDKRPLMVGEWSLGLGSSVFRGLRKAEKEQAIKDYAYAQQTVLSHASANFFWTYKTEDMTGWSYRKLVEKAIITR